MLDHLERAADAAARGASVPQDLFGDILEFIQVFVDRCHHGKEETELFPRLRMSRDAEIADRLEAEHQQGRALVRTFADAVGSYTPGDRASGARLQRAVDAYGDFLCEHIANETAELLPAMELGLGSQDHELVDAFERIELERVGAGTHERLHKMLDGMGMRVDRAAAALVPG